MSATESTTTPTASIETEETPALQNIGIEFEFPLYDSGSELPAPAADGHNSNVVRNNFGGRGAGWITDDPNDGNGYVGSDHVGAEITSGVLNLHDGSPEDWYTETIDRTAEAGYEFAATGYGDTVFGLHLHLSELDSSDADFIEDMASEEWGRVFFCSSISETSLDPWRHGGVSNPGDSMRSRRGNGHYEWRLPEPMLPDHFHMVLEFLRLVAHGEHEAAEEFARERVYERDSRLTPIRQYEQIAERVDGWPDERAVADDRRTDPAEARWFRDLMQSE